MKISTTAAVVFAAILLFSSVYCVPIPQDGIEGTETAVNPAEILAAPNPAEAAINAGNPETGDPVPPGGTLPGAEDDDGPDGPEFSEEIETSGASLANKKKAAAAAAAAAASSGGGSGGGGGGSSSSSSSGGGGGSSGLGGFSIGGGGSSSRSGGSSSGSSNGGGSSSSGGGNGGGSSSGAGNAGGSSGGNGGSSAVAATGQGSTSEDVEEGEAFYEPVLALAMAHLPIVIVLGILLLVLLCICGFSTKILSNLQSGQSSQLSHITDQFQKLKEDSVCQTCTEQQEANTDETVTKTQTQENQSTGEEGVEVRRISAVDRLKAMMPWNSTQTTEGLEKRFSLAELKDKIKQKTSFSNPITTCVQGESTTNTDATSSGKSKNIPKYLRKQDEIKAALKGAVPVAVGAAAVAVPAVIIHDEMVSSNAAQELQSAPSDSVKNATQQLKELEEMYRKQSEEVTGLLKSPENVATLQNLVSNPDQLRNLENLIEKPEELKNLQSIVQNPAEIKALGSVLKKPQELKTLEDLVQNPNALKQVESLMDRPEDMARLERSLDAPENIGGLDGVIGRARGIVTDLENMQGNAENQDLLEKPRALVKDLEAVKDRSIYGDRLSIPPKIEQSLDVQNSEAVNKLDRILQKFDEIDKLDAFNHDDGVEGLSDVSRPKGLDDYDRYSEDTSDTFDDVDPAKLTAAAKKLSKLPAGTVLGGNVQNSPPGNKVQRSAAGAPVSKLASPARKLSSGSGSTPVTATGVASKLVRPAGSATAIRGKAGTIPQQRAGARPERQAAVPEEEDNAYGQYSSAGQRQPRHVQFNPDVNESYGYE